MAKFIARRIATSALAIVVSAMLVFGLSRGLADPRYTLIGQAGYGMSPETWEQLGKELHLDKPVPIQFGYWIGSIAQGDFGQAAPTFWAGILAILLFTVWLGWLPVAGMGEGFAVRNYIMPSIVLAWLPAAGYLRFTRSAMLEALDSEFVKLARAKGVPWRSIIWKHAFRNASLVPLTATALVLAGFITGSALVEAVSRLLDHPQNR